MKPVLFIALYSAVVTLPLVVSWLVGGPPRPLRYELATGLGMLAFAMILVEFVLSGRFKRVSAEIGMDVTMRFHQIIARTALAFALLHPFLYGGTLSGGPRPWDPTRQLTLTADLATLSTGIVAFLLLPTLVLLAIGRATLDYKYETWRIMHALGALVIALLLLHHALYAGRYGSQPAMMWLWGVMTAGAVGSLAYFYVIVPLRQRSAKWRVTAIRPLTPKQWELTLAPDKHAGLSYKAGQFVWLNVGHSAFSLMENPFSLSSAPSAGPEVSFMIKELGDFTRTVGQLKPGTTAYLDGPFGNLCIDNRTEPGIALIAGGVGIAPLLGILRHLRRTNDPRAVKLVYGNKTADQIACRDELDPFDVTYVLSEPPAGWQGASGFIDAVLLDSTFTPDDFRTWVFVVCGPPVMMDLVEDLLIARGTPSHRILSERFAYD